jgi:hypothetical protein
MSGKRKLAGDILGIKRKHPSAHQVKDANVKNQEKYKDCPRMCKLFQQATDILLLPKTSLLGFDHFENISTYSKISKMKNGRIYHKERMEEKQDMKNPKITEKYWVCDAKTHELLSDVPKTEIKKVLEFHDIKEKKHTAKQQLKQLK